MCISTNQAKNWKQVLPQDLKDSVIKDALQYGIFTFDSIGYLMLEPNIKIFDLSVFNYNPLLEKKHLLKIFSVCVQVEKLVLDGCYLLDDSIFATLASSQMRKTLRSLSIAFCPNLTDKSAKILFFSNSFPQLQEAILDGCNSMEGKWQSEKSKNLKLKSLSLNQCYSFHPNNLVDLGTYFPNLEKISLGKIFRTPAHATIFEKVINNLPLTITDLCLKVNNHFPYNNFAAPMLRLAPKLISLDLSKISRLNIDQVREVVSLATNLTSLLLSGRKNKSFYGQDPNLVANNTKLVTLQIPFEVPLSPDRYPHLKSLSGIRGLEIIEQLTEYSGNLGQDFPVLPNLTKVKSDSIQFDYTTRSWSQKHLLYNCQNVTEFNGNIALKTFDFERVSLKKMTKLSMRLIDHVPSELKYLISQLSFRLTVFEIRGNGFQLDWHSVSLLKVNCPFLSVVRVMAAYDPHVLDEIFTFERLRDVKVFLYRSDRSQEVVKPIKDVKVACQPRKLGLRGDFTNEMVANITKKMPGLQFLNIQATDTTIHVLADIGQNCPALWKLTLPYLDLSKICNYETSRNGPHHYEHNYQHYLANKNWAKFLVTLPRTHFKNLRKLHIYGDDAAEMQEKFQGKYPHVNFKQKSGGYNSGGGPDER